MSHCLRSLLASPPWLPRWPCWSLWSLYSRLLMATWSLCDRQNLILPNDAREPRATAASSVTLFLQSTAPSLGFSGMPGSSSLGLSSLQGVSWGIQLNGGLSGHHFYIPTSVEPSHTFLRMPKQSWHVQLISCRPVSCPGSREPSQQHRDGVKGLYQDADSQVVGECTMCANFPLSGLLL